MYASSCRAVVLIGATAAFCTAFLPHIAKPSVASKRAEANHPGACPTQWLPVLLASDPVPYTQRRRLSGLTVGFHSMSAGGRHSCGVSTGGAGYCWGRDSHGQSSVPSGVTWAAISAGGLHSCGVSTGGAGYCWGADSYGQSSVPSGVTWAAILAGGSHSCGVSTGGAGYCWGRDDDGETLPPTPLPLLPSPPSLPPPSPPTPPPSSPTASSEDKTNSQGVPWVLSVSLSVLLVVAVVLLVLGYSRHSRISRDRANLRISRDRANLDLQMISHQVQIRVQTKADDSASLPDSLPAKRPLSLANTRTASLPPGPPSSSAGRTVDLGGSDTDGADLVQNVRTRSSLSSLPLGAPSGTAGGSSTAPPLTWAEADRQWLRAQGATHVEGLVLAGSSQNSTGFKGVYAFGGGFGAKLQRGAKRLRQDGFRSPVEAALARARWTKSLDEGKGHPSATAGASSGQQEQLAAEAPADLATVEEATVAQPVVSANTGAAHTHTTHKEIHPLRTQLEALSDAQFDWDKAPSSAPTPAPASAAPSTPSAPEVSFDVNLEELAVLVDLVDEEAVATLTNHLSDLADEVTAAPPPGLPARRSSVK